MTHRLLTHELDAQSLSAGLDTRRIGRRITVLPEVDSTNSYILDRVAPQGSQSDGDVIFAEYQTAGRGRLGRSWTAPRGAALTFSVLLWEPPGRLPPARIIMSAAVAVSRAIEQTTDVAPVIRWPNDIFVRDKKLAGILVEARACGNESMPIALGIGVNCLQQAAHLPAHLREKATSLEIESRQPIDRTDVARAILRQLDAHFVNPSAVSDADVALAWRQRSADIGQHVTLLCDGQRYSGRVVDINPQAGLLLHEDTGARREFDLTTISRV